MSEEIGNRFIFLLFYVNIPGRKKPTKQPFLVVDLDQNGDPMVVRNWISSNKIEILNVAGPREGKAPGIHDQAANFLKKVLITRPSTQRVEESQLVYEFYSPSIARV